jgi:hypothetical protein
MVWPDDHPVASETAAQQDAEIVERRTRLKAVMLPESADEAAEKRRRRERT